MRRLTSLFVCATVLVSALPVHSQERDVDLGRQDYVEMSLDFLTPDGKTISTTEKVPSLKNGYLLLSFWDEADSQNILMIDPSSTVRDGHTVFMNAISRKSAVGAAEPLLRATAVRFRASLDCRSRTISAFNAVGYNYLLEEKGPEFDPGPLSMQRHLDDEAWQVVCPPQTEPDIDRYWQRHFDLLVEQITPDLMVPEELMVFRVKGGAIVGLTPSDARRFLERYNSAFQQNGAQQPHAQSSPKPSLDGSRSGGIQERVESPFMATPRANSTAPPLVRVTNASSVTLTLKVGSSEHKIGSNKSVEFDVTPGHLAFRINRVRHD